MRRALPFLFPLLVVSALRGEEFKLVHKLKTSETIRTKITHLDTVDTNVKGVNQVVETRSMSCKTWHIEKVDAKGNATLTHAVEWVDLWNKVSDRPEIKYDSRVDEKAPPGYEHVSLSIGQPLSTITINAAGRITARKDAQPTFNPGIGDLTVPLPEQAIKVGGKWHVDEEVKLQDEQRRVKEIKVRHQY